MKPSHVCIQQVKPCKQAEAIPSQPVIYLAVLLYWQVWWCWRQTFSFLLIQQSKLSSPQAFSRAVQRRGSARLETGGCPRHLPISPDPQFLCAGVLFSGEAIALCCILCGHILCIILVVIVGEWYLFGLWMGGRRIHFPCTSLKMGAVVISQVVHVNMFQVTSEKGWWLFSLCHHYSFPSQPLPFPSVIFLDRQCECVCRPLIVMTFLLMGRYSWHFLERRGTEPPLCLVCRTPWTSLPHYLVVLFPAWWPSSGGYICLDVWRWSSGEYRLEGEWRHTLGVVDHCEPPGEEGACPGRQVGSSLHLVCIQGGRPSPCSQPEWVERKQGNSCLILYVCVYYPSPYLPLLGWPIIILVCLSWGRPHCVPVWHLAFRWKKRMVSRHLTFCVAVEKFIPMALPGVTVENTPMTLM